MRPSSRTVSGCVFCLSVVLHRRLPRRIAGRRRVVTTSIWGRRHDSQGRWCCIQRISREQAKRNRIGAYIMHMGVS